MRILVNFLFWTVGAVLVLPAIAGVAVGICLIGLIVLLAFVSAIAAMVLTVACCVPVVWWCAIFDSTRVSAYLSRLQVATQRQKSEGN
jgi:hypothetical protein